MSRTLTLGSTKITLTRLLLFVGNQATDEGWMSVMQNCHQFSQLLLFSTKQMTAVLINTSTDTLL